ncbi:UNVERIFIED_CONTAM: hypothetical protein HDU68_011220 [Siphonaria sp. JEL0065]|nr:hypothetical protein HDU68_011220 [Siphonaria sp. JEL0065]
MGNQWQDHGKQLLLAQNNGYVEFMFADESSCNPSTAIATALARGETGTIAGRHYAINVCIAIQSIVGSVEYRKVTVSGNTVSVASYSSSSCSGSPTGVNSYPLNTCQSSQLGGSIFKYLQVSASVSGGTVQDATTTTTIIGRIQTTGSSAVDPTSLSTPSASIPESSPPIAGFIGAGIAAFLAIGIVAFFLKKRKPETEPLPLSSISNQELPAVPFKVNIPVEMTPSPQKFAMFGKLRLPADPNQWTTEEAASWAEYNDGSEDVLLYIKNNELTGRQLVALDVAKAGLEFSSVGSRKRFITALKELNEIHVNRAVTAA